MEISADKDPLAEEIKTNQKRGASSSILDLELRELDAGQWTETYISFQFPHHRAATTPPLSA